MFNIIKKYSDTKPHSNLEACKSKERQNNETDKYLLMFCDIFIPKFVN